MTNTAAVASAPSAEDSRSDRLWIAALVLLIAAALGLRLAGLDFLLPQNMESDGGVVVRQVALIEEASADPWREDNWSYYPHLVARTVAAATQASTADARTLEEHLARAAAPHVRVRRVVAWLSLLAILATWWIARRFLAAGAAFAAAAFVATSQLELCFSQESRPHGPAAALAVLAVAAALRLRALPTLANYLLAGGSAGLAIGALQSGVLVLLPFFAAHLLRAGERRARDWGAFAAAFVPIVVCFLLFYPSIFAPKPTADAPELYVRGDGNVQFFGHTVFLGMFNGRGFANVWNALLGFEPVLLLLALLGVVLWLARSRRGSRDLLVVLAYVGPYLLVIGLYERTYERFVLQLVPFLACAAVAPFARLAGPIGPRANFRRIVATAAAVLALLPPTALALVLVTRRSAPDTSDRAAAWIAEHVQPGERVAIVPFVDVPLARTEEALADAERLGWLSPWLNYQLRERAHLSAAGRVDARTLPLGRKKQRDAALADPFGYLRASGARWVLLPVVGVLSTDASFRALRAALVEHARCAAVFTADARAKGPADVEDLPLDVGDSSSWGRRNWSFALGRGRATIGDVLELWDLEGAR
ncbi:MAG: hypothetical protein HZA53_08890 [Planctomycetes bacterium]|nr:hypothetical protein [Planctomycetota bacterium]